MYDSDSLDSDSDNLSVDNMKKAKKDDPDHDINARKVGKDSCWLKCVAEFAGRQIG